MAHPQDVTMVKDTLVVLFAAGVAVPLFRLFRLPAVLGFVLAGFLLGPEGFGALADEWPVLGFLTISEPDAVRPFAELGVLFLLFLLGLELSAAKLWALRRLVFGAGMLQAVLSAIVMALLALAMFDVSPAAAATIGLALALSSTAIVMQLLIEEHRAARPVGRVSLAILLLQDLLVAPILIFVGFAGGGSGQALVPAIADALWKGIAAVAIIVLIGRYVLRGAFRLAARSGGRDFLMALTLLLMVGAAVLTASAGLSLALGAFLAGLLLGETEFRHQTEVDLEPFKGILLGLFFMSVGMSLDLQVIARHWPVILGAVTGILLVKTLLAGLAVRAFTGQWPLAAEAAFLLAPAGEFAFVVIAAAQAGGLFGSQAAATLTAIAGLSMLLTPALSRAGQALAGRLTPPGEHAATEPSDYSLETGDVIIAGFGRVGQAIAHILHTENTALVALDRNPQRIANMRREGWKVYFGDAARPEILERAGARGAAMFVVTVDDTESAEAMVRAIRAMRAEAPILARARDAGHARRLRSAGASFVVPEAIEAGLQLASHALQQFGYAGETVRDRLATAREAETAAPAKARVSSRPSGTRRAPSRPCHRSTVEKPPWITPSTRTPTSPRLPPPFCRPSRPWPRRHPRRASRWPRS